MKRAVFRMGIGALCGVIAMLFVAQPETYAMGQGVVIRSIIAGDTLDTNDELVEIENTSSLPVDVTNWSLVYIASTNSPSTLLTIRASTDGTHVFLPAHARETFFSSKYMQNHSDVGGYVGAEKFTGKLALATAGLEFRDDGDAPIDTVRWGTWSIGIDSSPAASMSTTTILQRMGSDTDNNRNDFSLKAQAGQVFSYGSLYEVADQCSNIDGLQASVPADYIRESSGVCRSADRCPNIDGVQYEVPSGQEIYRDQCVPIFVPAALYITELLPNPSGPDAGNEFIELYNGSDEPVLLDDYSLTMGNKSIVFPAGVVLSARTYRTFSDRELGLVFANTTGAALTLLARNNQAVDQVPAYVNASIDMAWALVNDAWQYTNQPTPGLANLPSLIDDGELPTPDSGQVACKDGYYRNPLTNRCNKIQADEVPAACKPSQYRSEETGRCRNYATNSTPTPCKEGQYRSEETGRCRSIALTAAATLKPCNDDQFRNPATGRCKTIASTDDLPKPCAAGYERNIETNRCRKIQSSAMPLAAFPVEPVSPGIGTIGTWIAVASIVAAGTGYAVWEWRHEIARASRRLASRVGRK